MKSLWGRAAGFMTIFFVLAFVRVEAALAAAPGVADCPINVHYDEQCRPFVVFPGSEAQTFDSRNTIKATDGSGNIVILTYDPLKNQISFQNSCDSQGTVSVGILGRQFSAEPCGKKEFLFVSPFYNQDAAARESSAVNPDIPRVEKNQLVVSNDAEGGLVIYTPDGKTIPVKPGTKEIPFGPQSYALVDYNPFHELLNIKNPCGSANTLNVSSFGLDFSAPPCSSKNILLRTADDVTPFPESQLRRIERDEHIDDGRRAELAAQANAENISEGREPISAFGA